VDLKVEVLPGTRAVNGHELFVVEHRGAAVELAAASRVILDRDVDVAVRVGEPCIHGRSLTARGVLDDPVVSIDPADLTARCNTSPVVRPAAALRSSQCGAGFARLPRPSRQPRTTTPRSVAGVTEPRCFPRARLHNSSRADSADMGRSCFPFTTSAIIDALRGFPKANRSAAAALGEPQPRLARSGPECPDPVRRISCRSPSGRW